PLYVDPQHSIARGECPRWALERELKLRHCPPRLPPPRRALSLPGVAPISARHFPSQPARDQKPMAVQRTFSILKPDVTRRSLTGAVNQRIEAAGLRIVAQKRVHMTKAQAETFYGVHR